MECFLENKAQNSREGLENKRFRAPNQRTPSLAGLQGSLFSSQHCENKKFFPPIVNQYQKTHWGCCALMVCRAQNCKLSKVGIPKELETKSSLALLQLPGEAHCPGLKGRIFYCYFWVAKSCAQSCLTLCDPMDSSMPGFPVLHYLLEFAQIHNHWVGNAIQPFPPLLPPSPLALNLPQHQGLFQWVGPVHQMAKVQHFPGSSDGKECTCKCGRLRFDPWVRKIVGKGNVNLLQYSCLENSMDRRATGWLWSMGSQRWDTTEQLTFTYLLEFQLH